MTEFWPKPPTFLGGFQLAGSTGFALLLGTWHVLKASMAVDQIFDMHSAKTFGDPVGNRCIMWGWIMESPCTYE